MNVLNHLCSISILFDMEKGHSLVGILMNGSISTVMLISVLTSPNAQWPSEILGSLRKDKHEREGYPSYLSTIPPPTIKQLCIECP